MLKANLKHKHILLFSDTKIMRKDFHFFIRIYNTNLTFDLYKYLLIKQRNWIKNN